MRHPVRNKLFLMATALCLVAHGAIAMPDCHCADRESAPPCHESSPPERGACCAGEESAAAPAGCTTAMQSNCCSASPVRATGTAAVQVADHGGDEMIAGSASAPASPVAVGPPCTAAQARPPAPPGAPAWLLNSTLRN